MVSKGSRSNKKGKRAHNVRAGSSLVGKRSSAECGGGGSLAVAAVGSGEKRTSASKKHASLARLLPVKRQAGGVEVREADKRKRVERGGGASGRIGLQPDDPDRERFEVAELRSKRVAEGTRFIALAPPTLLGRCQSTNDDDFRSMVSLPPDRPTTEDDLERNQKCGQTMSNFNQFGALADSDSDDAGPAANFQLAPATFQLPLAVLPPAGTAAGNEDANRSDDNDDDL